MNNIFDKSLADLAVGLRSGVLKAQDLAVWVIDNHYRFDKLLNAYKTWDEEAVICQARAADKAFTAGIDSGLLQGVPVSVKDLFGVKGFPTFAGTRKQLPEQWEQEGPVITALRRQLAVITGKTHTVEFAFGGLGVNPHWKTPRNPWDSAEHRMPGGSSSGAGVSLCVGSALLALGTDTAGSVRIPASMTGNVGLKTSIGRWSTQGIVPLSPSLDTVGLLARSVEDAAFGFFALESTENNTLRQLSDLRSSDVAGLKLAICKELLWEDCSPGVAEGVKAALDELVGKGARLVSISLPELEQAYPVFQKGGLAASELYVFLKSELPQWLNLLDEKIAQRMEEAATLTASEYLSRVRMFERLSLRLDERIKEVDVVVSPTVAVTPPTMGEIEDLADYRQANLLSLRNTSVVNYLGLCALTMPVGLDAAGMPVGLHLIARHGEEQRLLTVAYACERSLGSGRARLGIPPNS